jgi:hypothetical protein
MTEEQYDLLKEGDTVCSTISNQRITLTAVNNEFCCGFTQVREFADKITFARSDMYFYEVVDTTSLFRKILNKLKGILK